MHQKKKMRHVGTDLFDAIGKKWIVLVDRYSGYAWTHQLRRTDTATVTRQLAAWFTEYGWPSTLWSDGGPQFRTEFLEKHGTRRRCFPQSAVHWKKAELSLIHI